MSKEFREGPLSEHSGDELRLVCLECDVETVHRILSSSEFRTVYSDDDFSLTSWDDYQVVECQGCRAVSFRHRNRNTENMDYDPRTGNEFLIETEKLYPPRQKGRAALDDVHKMPNQIGAIYTETLSALRAELPILTGIGLRAIVETVCKDRGAKGRDLKKRIDDLVTQHVLTPDGAAILHSLRVMGNDAAHEVKPHNVEILNVAFDVVEYVLQGVYTIPERAKKLPRPGAT